MPISDSNFTTFKCDSVLPQIGPKIHISDGYQIAMKLDISFSSQHLLTQVARFCDPKVTQVMINQVFNQTMFWVETTCWYLIDTTWLFNKNIPPPTFFPNSTHLHHVGHFSCPHQAEPPPPPKKKQTPKNKIQLFSWNLLLLGGSIRLSPGKYYRNRSTEVTYVPAKSRWLQTGFPHQSEVGTVGCGTRWIFFSRGFFGKLQLDV